MKSGYSMGVKMPWGLSIALFLLFVAIFSSTLFQADGGIFMDGFDNLSGANNYSSFFPGNNTTVPINSSNSSNINASTNFTNPKGIIDYGLDPEKKLRAERLISLFENDNIEIQYRYAEDLDDGRGITCGRAGFCTGCGDAYEVVRRYTEKSPGNVLAKYLPELKRLTTADDPSDTSGLNGFVDDWKTAANDKFFTEVQDEVSDELYYRQAMDYAQNIGIKTSLAKAILYDTIIQHGNEDDPDSISALLKRTEEAAGGNPKTGIYEKSWLKEFLEARRADLTHAYDAETRKEWAQSVSRVDVFSEILVSGNLNFNGPIKIANQYYEGRIIP